VVGVLMPRGEQPDINMSRLLVSHLGIRSMEINIGAAVDAVLQSFPADLKASRQTEINLPPRIRMATLYAVSQSVNGRVVNTCNYSEDFVGYSTRYGDMAGDFSPLGSLTVTEVKAIGHALGLPKELVEKVPSDGLTDKTDEDNLGFPYAALDEYIRTGICADPEIKVKIDKRHKANLFKLQPMPTFRYGNED